MKEVLKILIGCRDPQANAEKIVDIHDDAPLLKNFDNVIKCMHVCNELGTEFLTNSYSPMFPLLKCNIHFKLQRK